MTEPHFDARGCLSPSGIEAFREAPAGRAPADLAAHVASCARCQERLLAADRTRPREGRASARRPQPMRTLLLMAVLLLAAALALLSTRWVLGS
jgi:hypothetical protein